MSLFWKFTHEVGFVYSDAVRVAVLTERLLRVDAITSPLFPFYGPKLDSKNSEESVGLMSN